MEEQFKIESKYKPTGDQPTAIQKLLDGVKEGKKLQVLLGATGTGKTFTVANVIKALQKPTLILVHNKTLAGQLYAEMKELFPHNRVEYFVSNFDFYQPEAYIPKSDTYIDKNAVMNEEIEMMRTSAINSVLERKDTIVVASVASIYGLTDPDEYRNLVFELRVGETIDRNQLFHALIDSQYKRTNYDLTPGSFRVRGDIIEIAPASENDFVIRIDTFGDDIESISTVNSLTGQLLHQYMTYPIFPAYGHASTRTRIQEAVQTIKEELEKRIAYFHTNNKLIEAQRIEMRTRQDMDSLMEFGICPGIENYSRHIDKRKEGERPYTLLDYFPKDFLLIVDESHVTFPQVRGMYHGDRSRKETLVEFGFRLPSALDNRPLRFDEFESLMPTTICTSATPGDYELERCNHEVVEQIIRPTGLLDPIIEVRSTMGQIEDLLHEIQMRIQNHTRVMVVTLTIRMAEDLTTYLKDRGIKTAYLHNETKTLERTQIIYELRKGKYDVLVGINLLREGLDIPEVSLIAILDADKEGFLRSSRSLIQIIGRAARNKDGKVIMYGDHITDSMQYAIQETNRRRSIQQVYNEEHHMIPQTIVKEIHSPIGNQDTNDLMKTQSHTKKTRKEKELEIRDLEKRMKEAARNLDFEKAAQLRDILLELKASLS